MASAARASSRRASSRRASLGRSERAWLARLARVGLASVGVSYALVGILALMLAIGVSGAEEDREGALARVAATGWGMPLLVAVAAGFAGYAAWRAARAVLGENVENARDRGWGKRGIDAVRGLFYAGLTFAVVRIAFGSSSGGDEQSQAATVMGWPGGRVLVGAAGVGFVAAAVWNVYRALTKKYEDQLKTWQIPRARKRAITAVAHYGLIARGVVFGLIGWFVIRAALDFDPDKAIGLDGALHVVAQQPYGRGLLAIVAAGLLAYALYRVAESRYREV